MYQQPTAPQPIGVVMVDNATQLYRSSFPLLLGAVADEFARAGRDPIWHMTAQMGDISLTDPQGLHQNALLKSLSAYGSAGAIESRSDRFAGDAWWFGSALLQAQMRRIAQSQAAHSPADYARHGVQTPAEYRLCFCTDLHKLAVGGHACCCPWRRCTTYGRNYGRRFWRHGGARVPAADHAVHLAMGQAAILDHRGIRRRTWVRSNRCGAAGASRRVTGGDPTRF